MKDELRGLTIARFFAAMWVVLYHCGGWPDEIMLVVGAGGIGVPFFFVLSGFVLAYTARDMDRPGGKWNFYVRRVARIYPVYLLAWAIYGAWLVMHAEERSALSGTLTALLLQSWVPGMHGEWNSPAWSLSVEALFYATFPVIFLALVKLSTQNLLWVLGGTWVANIGYIVANQAGGMWGDYAYFHPVLRLPEFVAGCVLGLLFLRRGAIANGGLWTAAAIVGVLVIVATRSWMGPWWEAIIMPAFCALIMALASVKARGKVWDVGVLLGKSSYAVYILQIPVWSLMWTLAGQELNEPRSLPVLAIYWVVLIGVSVAVYQWLESPLEKWIKAKLSKDRRLAPDPVLKLG